MITSLTEHSAIRSKALAMIERAVSRVKEIDKWHFPTFSTEDARKLILSSLEAIRAPTNLVPMDPAVLYMRFFSIEQMIHLLESSSIDHISWPIVGYYDEIWDLFFGKDGPKVFYSVTVDHNYKIRRFSKTMSFALRDLLPHAKVESLLSGKELYCLELASSEDNNLPMYANIGHEFGHVVHDQTQKEISPLFINHFLPVFENMSKDIIDAGPSKSTSHTAFKIVNAIGSLAEELFSDMVGAILLGPAFYLSLSEMGWGLDRDSCKVHLLPTDDRVRAHPSFNFRLKCIRHIAQIDNFCEQIKVKSQKNKDMGFINISDYFLKEINAEKSEIVVSPSSDSDSAFIEHIFKVRLPEMNIAFESFVNDCEKKIRGLFKIPPSCDVSDVMELILRLRQWILPNIVPNGTLLGKVPSFNCILTASALCRIESLANGNFDKQKELSNKIYKIDRLTEKALEVSLIQRMYNERPKR
ncbi:MAG: hypothetical protein PHR77_06010 [Kiritimatiellae bacterium]|nr:hypothetical protein [Kiritimatiellia bacterium]MDD5522474.1 hypothetical protein [Kiritimatiellia bacterium]